ncbi:MAG: SgcJ/EcaC family oxidoreductase [Gemmatimonadaceae bacterium]
MTTPASTTDAERSTRTLYDELLLAWNKRNARNYALLFASDASLIGFDGSQVDGQLQIGAHVSEIFSHHQTGAYAGIVREVRPVSEDVTILRANAGLIPAGEQDLKPELNAVQTLVAVRRKGDWRIALFQNTPAAFHGRPDDVKKLTEELRAAAAAAH